MPGPTRRLALARLLAVTAACGLLPPGADAAAAAGCHHPGTGTGRRPGLDPGGLPEIGPDAWPDWQAFKQALLTPEGRIADPRDGRFHTVSEAQAYALFFALVANDRPVFDALLDWTERELCGGEPATTLPAWHWGRDGAGPWRVLDRNAASDADLWLAYTLAQAGRLWRQPALTAKAGRVASLIASQEVVATSASDQLLLPGPVGFVDAGGLLRVNPSYLPLPVLRWFAAYAAGPVWPGLLRGSIALLQASAPHGLAPDWHDLARPAIAARAPAAGASADHLAQLSREQRLGGFDAIRVYLWLGLSDAKDPDRARLLARYARMCDAVERLGQPPLSVDPARPVAGQVLQPGPRGFAAALLPFARALGRPRCVALLEQRLQHEPADAAVYYDAALGLFAQGHLQARYRFGVDGSLWTAWSDCLPTGVRAPGGEPSAPLPEPAVAPA